MTTATKTRKTTKKTTAKKNAPAKTKAPKAPKAPLWSSYPAQAGTKTYKGKAIAWELAADGAFTADGYVYGSPTAAALEITGAGERGKTISGPAFFRLTK